jgi:hypothetical protein
LVCITLRLAGLLNIINHESDIVGSFSCRVCAWCLVLEVENGHSRGRMKCAEVPWVDIPIQITPHGGLSLNPEYK